MVPATTLNEDKDEDMNEALQGNITISRGSNDVIRIEIEDKASGIRFVNVKITPEQLGLLVTGRSFIPCEMEVRSLQYLGKTYVSERRSLTVPQTTFKSYFFDKNELSAYLVENAQEDSWLINPYLGSQASISYHDGNVTLNYSVFKYV